MAMIEMIGPSARRLVSSITPMAMAPITRSAVLGEETRNIA